MKKVDLETLRVYEGAQGEYAECGKYDPQPDGSYGTYMHLGERVYGKPWTLTIPMTPELQAALDSARRRVRM